MDIVCALVPVGQLERMPSAASDTFEGVKLPRLHLPARQAGCAADMLLDRIGRPNPPLWPSAG
jgi:hypothetical protein